MTALTKAKKERLREKGWEFGTIADALDLTPAEEAMVEMKLRLVRQLRELRKTFELNQTDFGKQFGASQSRVAKMEAGDPSVSVEALMQALCRLDYSADDVGKVISGGRVAPKGFGGRQKGSVKKAAAKKGITRAKAKRKIVSPKTNRKAAKKKSSKRQGVK